MSVGRLPVPRRDGAMRDSADLERLQGVSDHAGAEATGWSAVVRRAAGGDEVAFARLVAQHHATMTRVAYAIAGDAEVAADAVQSAWSIAWRRLGSVRDPEQVGSWLIAIAANESRGLMRRQRRRTVVELSARDQERHEPDPGDRIEVVDLARALRQLSPDDRTLLALRFVAGMDSGQIADHLQLSASGVRSRLARLLERLRGELDHA